jgi:hypothetical protein
VYDELTTTHSAKMIVEDDLVSPLTFASERSGRSVVFLQFPFVAKISLDDITALEKQHDPLNKFIPRRILRVIGS